MIPSITSMDGAFSLEGKNALVTGGNRGLGGAIASAFAHQGANVAIFCRDQAKAAEKIEELGQYGGKYEAYSCDVSDLLNVRETVAKAWEDFGGFEILVNNAGVAAVGDLVDMDESLDDWYRVLNTDLNGIVHMTYEVAKRMRDAGKGGSIINITSNAGFMVNHLGATPAYSTAKAAANHFTHCMASELSKYDIRVNAIAPGYTETDLGANMPQFLADHIQDQTVTGRQGKPIEVGALAVYLASPAAAQVTGEISVIDGGYMLRC